jgi:hypothetical protein
VLKLPLVNTGSWPKTIAGAQLLVAEQLPEACVSIASHVGQSAELNPQLHPTEP